MLLDIKKVAVSGIAAGIAIFIVMYAVGAVIQAVAPYDVLSLGGMRAVDDPLMVLFLLYPIVIGIVLAVLYQAAKSAFTGTVKQQGIKLGLLGWAVSSIPSAWVVFTSMNYPVGFTADSIVTTFVYMIAAGLVIAKLG